MVYGSRTGKPPAGFLPMPRQRELRLMSMPKKYKGLTYLEVLVATAVAALLAAIAVPSYQASIRKNNRTDAYTALARIASAQEGFFNNQAQPRAYTDDLTVLEVPSISVHGHYDLSVAPCPGRSLAECYIATAAARSDSVQYKDTNCQQISLDSRGVRSSSPATSGCWRE